MMLKFKLIQNGKMVDISEKIENVEWSDSTDQLGSEFSFSLPFSTYDPNFRKPVNFGDIYLIKNGTAEVLRGIITGRPIDSGDYKGFDFAFYLNKSEDVIQFKKISAEKAIRQLCSKYKVPIGKMEKLPTLISKVYKGMAVSDIIRDILQKVRNETGKGYRMEMNKGKLDIIRSSFIKITPTFKDAEGKTVKCISQATVSGDLSIEELKNNVVVSGTDEKKLQIKATASDAASIKKYGLLTATVSQDKLNESKARNIAKNKLKELNRTSKNISLEMPGNVLIKAGRLIEINKPEYGLKGWYGIKASSHSIVNGVYTTKIDLR